MNQLPRTPLARSARALLALTMPCLLAASCGACADAPQRARTLERAPASASAKPPTAARRHGLTPEQAALVVVDLGARTVTLGDFAERLAAQSPAVLARYDTPDGRREVLARMVEHDLLADEAERQGYATHPNVALAGSHAMVERMMHDQFVKHGPKLSDITDAELRRHDAERAEHLVRNRVWRARQQAAVAQLVTGLRTKAHVQVDTDRLLGTPARAVLATAR